MAGSVHSSQQQESETTPPPKLQIVCAPRPFPTAHDPSHQNISIFLSGSITDVGGITWQNYFASQLQGLPITVLDPLRPDWDSTWKEDISDPRFHEQVNWELEMLEKADLRVVYFAPSDTAVAPISLLEFGLFARESGDRVFVICPAGYKKRGNVQIVCGKYGIPFKENLDEAVSAVKERIARLIRT